MNIYDNFIENGIKNFFRTMNSYNDVIIIAIKVVNDICESLKKIGYLLEYDTQDQYFNS